MKIRNLSLPPPPLTKATVLQGYFKFSLSCRTDLFCFAGGARQLVSHALWLLFGA